MSEWQSFKASCMQPPKIEQIEKENGEKVWRVTYAGMIKEHAQDWQAKRHYGQACEVYVQQLATKPSGDDAGR